MGSALQINVVDKAGFDQEESEFILSVINNFADEKKIPLSKAYNYLVTFKGMDFLRQYQDIEKTLSYHEIVNDVSRVCANNGGRLWFSITAVTNSHSANFGPVLYIHFSYTIWDRSSKTTCFWYPPSHIGEGGRGSSDISSDRL